MTAQEANINITASCVGGTSYDDCVTKISKGQADLVTLDGGSVFEAGRMSTTLFDRHLLMISIKLATCCKKQKINR